MRIQLVHDLRPMLKAPLEVSTMNAPCLPMLAWQWAVGKYVFAAFASMLVWYGVVLDPRPDLAVPARRVRLPYAWWW